MHMDIFTMFKTSIDKIKNHSLLFVIFYSSVLLGIVFSLSGYLCDNYLLCWLFQSILEQWRHGFWVVCCITLVTTTVFSFWASADIQPWNEPTKREESTNCRKTEKIWQLVIMSKLHCCLVDNLNTRR